MCVCGGDRRGAYMCVYLQIFVTGTLSLGIAIPFLSSSEASDTEEILVTGCE